MRNSKLAALALALVVCMEAGLCLAQPGMEAKPRPTEVPAPHLTWRQMMDKLQLTNEQRQAVLKNRHAYRRAMAEIEGKVKVKQVELENEFEKPDPDQTKLDLIVQEIGVLYGQRLGEKVKAKLELEKKILNPQQVDLLKTLEGPQTEEEP